MHMHVLIITPYLSHRFLQAHWRATAEPASADLYVRPRVDSESLHRSALSDGREMAFVPHKRCLSCDFAIVSRKKDFSFSWMLETLCEWLSAQPTVS